MYSFKLKVFNVTLMLVQHRGGQIGSREPRFRLVV